MFDTTIEVVGYTISFEGSEKMQDALRKTIGDMGVPLFPTEERAGEFGQLIVDIASTLFGLDDAEVKVVQIFKA